jgi:type VI secretion system secreted protein VgrG
MSRSAGSGRNLVVKVEGHELNVMRFKVVEEICIPFECTLWAKVENHAINLESVVGHQATFSIKKNGSSRSWHGVVSDVRQVHAEPTGNSTYRVKIVPTLWLTTMVHNHRVFQHETLPDIVDKVLKPYKIKPLRQLRETYPPHDYIVQYGESDFDFVNRMLEQAGISYYFEHGRSTKLIFSDAPHKSEPRAGAAIHYVDEPNIEAREDYITHVRLAHRFRPGKVSMRDFSFRRPAEALEAEATDGSPQEQKYEHYHYAPGSFLVETDSGSRLPHADDADRTRHQEPHGKRLAKNRLGALRRARRTVSFASNVPNLCPGVVFKMAGHPHDEISGNTKLLITDYVLTGSPTGFWQLSGEASFCADAYHCAIKTREPRIAGVQSATVVGPKGEEIATDEYGRVRTQFHWDRGGKGISHGQRSSPWMRVSQHWAGPHFGAMFVPRIGNEVLVRYFDGQPNRPAVVGRVHNKLQPVPYPLPKHDIKALWKTDTTPHEDDSYNEIRLDDRKKLELFYMQAEQDRRELVKEDETERTGDDRVAVVGQNRAAIVGKKDTTLVGKQFSVQVMKPPKSGKDKDADKDRKNDDKQLKILKQKMPKLELMPTKIDMTDEHILATTSSATLEMDGKEVVFEAKTQISLKAGGSIIIKGGPKVKINS